jgi:hypothetical protein
VWLPGSSLRLPELLGQLSVRLLTAGERTAALDLLRALLDTTTEDARSRRGEVEVRSRYDAFEFENVSRKVLPRAVALGGMDVLLVLCAALAKAVDLTLSSPDARDDGCSFRSAIEDHRQNMPYTQPALSLLIEAVRDASDSLANADPVLVPGIVRELEGHKQVIFRRLVLYTLHRHPAADHASLARYLLRFEDIESPGLWHERRLLERAGFAHLTAAEKAEVLAQIWKGPDISTFIRAGESPPEAEVERRVNQWRVHHLFPLVEVLSGPQRAEYDRLVAEAEVDVGGLSHPDFLTYIGEVWKGPTSPFRDDELAAMSVDQLVAYLSTWQPSNQFMSPSREGVGRSLKRVVAGEPKKLLDQWVRLRQLHPTYVRAVIEGLTEALTGKRAFSWERAVAMCSWVVAQRTEDDDLTSDESADRDEDPGWSWTRKAVAELLRTGLADADDSIPAELHKDIWRTISDLGDQPDPDTHIWGNAFEQALNTLHGAAIHAALEFTSWRMRRTRGHTNAAPDGLLPLPEVAAFLERHLDPIRDPSPASRAMFGLYLSRLVAVDERWVREHLPLFFPTDPALAASRDATWTSYVEHSEPYPQMLDLVRDEYERSLRALAEPGGERADRDRFVECIVRHVVGLYWLGSIPLQGGLLDDFYTHADVATRAALLKHVGFAFYHAESVDPAIAARVQALWAYRVAEAKTSRTGPVELAQFGWWFASGKFEDQWCLDQLRSMLEMNVYPEMEFAVAETLGRLAESRPLPALDCLARMLTSEGERQWRVMRCRNGITKVLTTTLSNPDPKVAQAARELCNRLVAWGNREFLELLPPVAPAPRAAMPQTKMPSRKTSKRAAKPGHPNGTASPARRGPPGILSAIVQRILGLLRSRRGKRH